VMVVEKASTWGRRKNLDIALHVKRHEMTVI
jgi:hypothetical protein